ncbi:MAG: HU family DNA-binding protein [Bacteroidaceae bacterium]|nr:HU family DNA-binding protein [Bacteroidaceae bacterium]
MDKKLNFTDLCNFYAKASGVPAAEAESFVHAFFEIVVEGLEKDGAVKINGLGTFKLVEVESRSSVNINTGERFEIDGHKRLTFVPADSLKEIINAPFAMFEPVEVEDDFDDDDDKDVANEDASLDEAPVAEEQEEAVIDSVEGVAEEQAPVEEISPATEIIEEATETSEEPISVESEEVTAVATEELAAERVIEPEVAEEVIEEKIAEEVSTFLAKVEIEEEMPVEAASEDVSRAVNVEIEEEMPIDEADYAAEEVAAGNIAEPVQVLEEAPVEEPAEEAMEDTPEEIVEEVAEEPQSESVEEPQIDNIEEKPEEKEVVPAVAKEKITPIKEKSLYFDTLPRKKKSNKFLKVVIFLAVVALCAGAAFIGMWYYENKYYRPVFVKEQIAVIEKVETPVVEVPADTLTQSADSVVATEDSLSVVAVDTVAMEPEIIRQKDSVAEQPQIKEVKKPVERFKIVDALAVRELSTIFVADTTDYRITGTLCTHKVKSEETLIRISLNHYGDKRLWPYIVKYNNMVRPNDLACDMVLKIPRLVPRK